MSRGILFVAVLALAILEASSATSPSGAILAPRNVRLRPHREPRLASPDEAKLADRLNDPITVNFLDEPLKDALAYVSEIQRLRMEFDEDPLMKANMSWEHKVTITLEQVSCRMLLKLLLEPIQLDWTIRGDRLVVSTAAEANRQQIVWRYDIGDLADGGIPADDLADTVMTMIAPKSWKPSGGTSSLKVEKDDFVIGQTPGVHQGIVRLLHDIWQELSETAAQRCAREDRMVTIRYDVTRFVAPDGEYGPKFMISLSSNVFPWTWERFGGRGSSRIHDGELEITQYKWVHERLARLFDLISGMARSPAGVGFVDAGSAMYFAYNEVNEGSALEEATRRQVSVEYENQELPEILRDIQQTFGVRCFVKPQLIIDLGLASKRISINLNNVPLRDVVDRVSNACGLDWYVIDNSAVLLVLSDEAAARRGIKVYRTRELLDVDNTGDTLVKKITVSVEPKTWTSAGGSATIRSLPGLLVVSHHRRALAKIEDLLAGLQH